MVPIPSRTIGDYFQAATLHRETRSFAVAAAYVVTLYIIIQFGKMSRTYMNFVNVRQNILTFNSHFDFISLPR